MTGPLPALAFLAIFAGWVGLPWLHHGFSSFVYHDEVHHAGPNYILMIVSTIVAVSGIGLAYLMYYKKAISADAVAERFKLLYKISFNKWYIDEIYDAAIIKPLLGSTKLLWWFDANVIDGMVNLMGWLTVKWADLKMWFDKYIIDGIVNGLGYLCMAGSWAVKFIQSGSLQFYTLIIMAAAIGIILYRVTSIGFYFYLIGLVIVALLSVLVKMTRSDRVDAEPNIEG